MKNTVLILVGLVSVGSIFASKEAVFKRTPKCLALLGDYFLEKTQLDKDERELAFLGVVIGLHCADYDFKRAAQPDQMVLTMQRMLYPGYYRCELQQHSEWAEQAREIVSESPGSLPDVEEALKNLNERN